MFEIKSQLISPKQVIISKDLDYPMYRQELIDFCYQQKDSDLEGQHFTNVGGWQSSDILHKTAENKFFFRRLNQNLKKCFEDYFVILDNFYPKIIRMWIQISNKGHYNLEHTHPMCHYSGVFYVKCENNDPKNGFLRISDYSNAHDFQELLYRKGEIKDEFLMHPSFTHLPEEGKLLLFPSSIKHSVSLNEYDSDRISIAFDINFYKK